MIARLTSRIHESIFGRFDWPVFGIANKHDFQDTGPKCSKPDIDQDIDRFARADQHK